MEKINDILKLCNYIENPNTRTKIRDFINSIRKEGTMCEWKPAIDSPEEGSKVIVSCSKLPFEGVTVPCTRLCNFSNFRYIYNGIDITNLVEYWMYMPKPYKFLERER